MEALCQKYWPPLYAFVRKSGYAPHEAEDITQSFFERLLEKNFHLAANPERGRFRSFLLGSMRNFLANWHRDAACQKRGGGAEVFSLDLEGAEQMIARQLEASDDPEKMYHRSWAIRLMEVVLEKLREEYVAEGVAERFEALRFCLDGSEDAPRYAELAKRFDLSESGVKSAVARIRKRFRELYREEIAQVVGDLTMVDDEIRMLMSAL